MSPKPEFVPLPYYAQSTSLPQALENPVRETAKLSFCPIGSCHRNRQASFFIRGLIGLVPDGRGQWRKAQSARVEILAASIS